MLEREWPLLIAVALEADRIALRAGAELAGLRASVNVVAIGTANQAFVHPVTKRLVELHFVICMARITQIRLLVNEQVIRFFRFMRTVTGSTTYTVLVVLRPLIVCVFTGIGMACEAAIADRLARIVKVVDFGFIATRLDVCRSRAMTGLASMDPGSLCFIGRELVVCSAIDALELIFVTAPTGFRAHKISRGLRCSLCRGRRLLCALVLFRRNELRGSQGHDQ